ncbi:MAG: ABC transporter ATP-binding protein [Actinomycetota bacterium]
MSLLEIRGLCLRFRGLVALDSVDLSVAEGEVVGLIGPNGAGKSTLLNAISGFLVPNEGKVALDGEDMLSLLPHERASRGIARTFQAARLSSALTVRENLLASTHAHHNATVLGAGFGSRRARAAEARAQEEVDAALGVIDLSSWLDRRAGTLSYGTLRMLELACVVVQKPRLLLLDEPASGIAQRETEALGPLLLRIRDVLGATVLIVEHDLALVRAICTRLVAMDLGRVIADGRPEDVLGHAAVLESYLGRPARAGGRV